MSQPTDTRQQSGRDGEDIAVAFLSTQGYTIVTRNWRLARMGLRGEIDIVAWCRDGRERILCFIEVKTRTSAEGGTPQEAVTPLKQSQICKLATVYVSQYNLANITIRFDVVEVWLLPGEKLPRVALHQNAFEYQK